MVRRSQRNRCFTPVIMMCGGPHQHFFKCPQVSRTTHHLRHIHNRQYNTSLLVRPDFLSLFEGQLETGHGNLIDIRLRNTRPRQPLFSPRRVSNPPESVHPCREGTFSLGSPRCNTSERSQPSYKTPCCRSPPRLFRSSSERTVLTSGRLIPVRVCSGEETGLGLRSEGRSRRGQ